MQEFAVAAQQFNSSDDGKEAGSRRGMSNCGLRKNRFNLIPSIVQNHMKSRYVALRGLFGGPEAVEMRRFTLCTHQTVPNNFSFTLMPSN